MGKIGLDFHRPIPTNLKFVLAVKFCVYGVLHDTRFFSIYDLLVCFKLF